MDQWIASVAMKGSASQFRPPYLSFPWKPSRTTSRVGANVQGRTALAKAYAPPDLPGDWSLGPVSAQSSQLGVRSYLHSEPKRTNRCSD
eukprot:12285853-Prorocentrum_lima.AAC.1